MRAQRVGTIVGISFYFFILIEIGRGFAPITPKPPPALLKSFLAGTDEGYPALGSEFEPFQKWLPKGGVISFLTDQPHWEESTEAATIYRNAQTSLCPLVLNQEPTEPIAIVYCKDRETAERRILETGYRWVAIIADGKGIAAKTS